MSSQMKRKRNSQPAGPVKKANLYRQNAIVGRMIASTEEKKNIDEDQNALLVVAQATAVRSLINPCAQGTTAVTRAGRRTMMTQLSYLFQAALITGSTGASAIRLLIVYDRQSNGVAPAATDVVVADQLDAPMNLANSRRFKILVDEVNDGISTAGPASVIWKGFRDFTAKGTKRGLECEFKDTSAGNITDITTGSIYSFVWSNGTFGTTAPESSLYTRIRFTDA